MLGRQPKLIATMKKLFLIVAAMFAVVSFSACSDDDDKDVNPNQIIGTWQITLGEGWETLNDGTRDNWSIIYPDTSDDNYYWTYAFKDNGICVRESHSDYYNSGDDYTNEYTYSISGNILTMKNKTDSELDFVCTIKRLTSEQLILFFSGTDDAGKFEETENYKRIK